MKNLLIAIIIVAGNIMFYSCGEGTGQGEEEPKDSQMVAEHVDPSTKFPQQVIEEDTLQTDKAFVENAVQSGEELAGLADLAVKKASHAAVKEIATTISADHRKWVSELRKLKKQPKDSATRYADKSREELEKLSGNAFDRQWVEKMITKNAAVTSRYETESATARNKDIKKLVSDALPEIKQHQQQLEACRTKLQ